MYCFLSLCPSSACLSLLPVGANILFFNFFLQFSLLLFSACWSKCTVFYLFAPSLLHPPVLPLEQTYFISTLYSKPACFTCFAIGATTLHIHSLLQACLLLPSACWSKCTVFYLFAPALLYPPVLPLEQQYFISTLYSKPACFTFLPVGANVLFSISLPQVCFILQFCHWSNHSSYTLFTPSLLASSFCPLEQIFFFSTFPPIQPQSGSTSISGCIQIIRDPV